MSHYHGWLERPIYKGHTGLTEVFELWLEPWDDFYIEIREAVDLPGDRSFAVGYNRARGRLSGAEVELPPVAQIVDFRDGRILRVDNYSDIAEARRAAGLAGAGPASGSS
jgi:ketosteroid isomerase-like protein